MKHTKIFLYGNTGYINSAFIKRAFKKDSVLILGKTDTLSNIGLGVTVLPYSGERKEVISVFDSYEFDQIVYFSEYLSYKHEVMGEVERLKLFLDCCKKQQGAKFLYITGPQIENGIYDNRVIQKTIRKMLIEYIEVYNVDIKILTLPFLYSLNYKQDYFYKLFENFISGVNYTIYERKDHIIPCISMEDLSELVYKIFDSWNLNYRFYSAQDEFQVTLEQIVVESQKCMPNIDITYGKNKFDIVIPKSDINLRTELGWFMHYSILSEIETICSEQLKSTTIHRQNKKKKRFFSSTGFIALRKPVEIIILFFLVEIVEKYTNSSAQFANLDLRLVFVALVSTYYGAGAGIFGALLAAFGFILAYILDSNNWHTLFYNVESWMPVVIYLFVGAICGYFQMRKNDDLELVRVERDKLKDKFTFTQQLYSDIVLDKKMMKNEITGMRDGMGRIVTIVEKLEASTCKDIQKCACNILNEWFETDNARIYLLDKDNKGGWKTVEGGIRFSDYPILEREILKYGFWANQNGLHNYPIYASMIRISKEISAVIWISMVDPEHITLYDINGLKMLTRLIESAMVKKYFEEIMGMEKS